MMSVTQLVHEHPQHGAYSPQQKLQLEAMHAPWQAGQHMVSVEERERALTLGRLASQHQASEYNRLKFGAKGAPFAYVPISIQYPQHVHDLRVRQAQSALRAAWWLAARALPPSVPVSVPVGAGVPEQHSDERARPSLHPPASASLQHELSLAMSSQLSLRVQPVSAPPKTSETHPINISSLVPAELLPLLSASVAAVADAYPTVFRVPAALQLDQLTNPHPHARPPSYPPVPYPPLLPTLLALDAAELASTLDERPSASAPAPRDVACTTAPEGEGASASNSNPRAASGPPSKGASSSSPGHDAPRLLGNLLLSSCPGKKVRLTGPVKGRGSICRDLRSDLSRVKDLGVACVVCCLDDDELDFLGASWPDYARIASSVGLDVLRLPTPEGLAPLAPRVIDDHLARLISQYTLRGVPTLVHCRGGVGRAGLVACCWMLKLGLCGPVAGGPSDSIALVERAIRVVRRRRSVKAIETFEQVRFLVDFVDYLRDKPL